MSRAVYGLGVCLVAAAWLYFYRVGALSLTTDEIYHAISARSILEHGLPTLSNGRLYLKALPFSYLGAGLAALLGSVELGIRVASGLSALLAGVALFKLGSRLLDERAGLLASMLFLFHPWTIELARWGRLYVLAGALLTLSALYWVRFEASRTKRDAALASGWLLAASVVYPFSLWGGVALGACWITAQLSAHPERAPRLLAGIAGALIALALAVLALDHYAPALMRATHFYSKFSLDEFTGFSAYYSYFYLTDLFVFSASALALLAWTLRGLLTGAEDKTRLRRIGLLVLTMGGVGLITFVHLQTRAYRYLFPIFPAMIATALLAWSVLIERLGTQRASAAYGTLAVLALGAYGAYGAYGIPLKHHGDPYLNPDFGPTTKRLRYASFRGPALYVAEQLGPDDIVLSDAPQFYYYYAQREADYALVASKTWPKGEPYYYMKQTRVLTKQDALRRTLKRARQEGRTVWLTLNTSETHERFGKVVQHELTPVWRDPEDRQAVVYCSDGLREATAKSW